MLKNNFLTKGLVLSSALVLAACGNGNDSEANSTSEDNVNNNSASDVEVAKEGFPIVDEEITLSIMAPGTGMSEWEDMVTLQEYEEMTGINLEYNTPPMDDFGTRFNLSFASQELPDMIFAPGSDVLTPALEVDYGQQGLLMPLNDLIEDYAPNLKKLLDERPEVRQAITTPDGNIYALPRVDDGDTAAWPIGPLWYNGAWLDALDAEVPETLDEFYDLLVRFRDEDPNGNGVADEIPISNAGMANPRVWFLSAFDLHAWGAEEKDGEVVYTPMTDNARAYFEFFNKLYEEELIDQEIFSQSDEMKKAKGEENRIGLFQDWFSFFTTGQSEEDAMNNPMFLPLTSEWSPERSIAGSPQMARGTFAITTANEHPEASMRWIDYLYSPEGHDLFNHGPEGHYWVWEDEEQTSRAMTERAAEEGEEYRGTLSPLYGLSAPGFGGSGDELPPIGDGPSPFAEFIREETEEKVEPYSNLAFPLVYLTDEEIEEIQGVSGDLATYIQEEEAKFITGQLDVTDDAVWDNYVSTLENMGVDRYIEIYQAAYDRSVEAVEE